VKPYYEDGSVTIYHGDCREVLASLVGLSVDLVFTSPPYNMGRDHYANWSTARGLWKRAARPGGIAHGYGAHSDAMPQAIYEEWQRDVLRACWRILSPTGAIFYNHKPRVLDGSLWTPLVLNPDLPLRQILIWDRVIGMNFSRTHFLPMYEWIMVFARKEFRLTTRGASGHGDVWTVQPMPSEHPAPFPLALPTKALDATGATTVLDPFAGSGTTLRAAKDLSRKAIGIEIEERYCEIAAQRCAQEVFDFGEAA
jgi:site-specific DNA-methyltransferase (adenine-specific)